MIDDIGIGMATEWIAAAAAADADADAASDFPLVPAPRATV